MSFRHTRKNPLATARDVEPNVAAAVSSQVPVAVDAEVEAKVTPAIDADLASRNIGFVDEGGGQGHFTVGGVPISGTLVPPAATWSGVAGKDGGTPSAGDSAPVRRGATWQWPTANPVLADGELAYENDTGLFKIGDGVHNWNQLPFKNRRSHLRAVEREHRSKAEVFELPEDFDFDPGFTILTDGLSYWTNYDASARANAGGNTIYWNVDTGSNSTGDGTEGNPYATFAKCYQEANDGDTIVMQSKWCWRAGGPAGDLGSGTNEIAKSINLVAAHPGETTIACADLLSWSETSGRDGVYEAARTGVRVVLDISMDRDGILYHRAASLDECEATPMSWYQASNLMGPVYVHTPDGTAPDPDSIVCLLTAHHLNFTGDTRAADVNFYVEGIRFLGSMRGIVLGGNTPYKLTWTARDCEFLHLGYDGTGGTVTQGDLFNGISVYGNVNFFAQNCRVAYTALDGFNYHSAGSYIPTFVELNCEAHDCGREQASVEANANQSQNATTAHDGVKGLRLGGKYHHSYGAVIADINADTQTLNLSCDVWGTRGIGWPSQGISAQASGSEMWVYGCRSWGAIRDMYVAEGATMHVSNSEYETVDGGGTFDVISPAR